MNADEGLEDVFRQLLLLANLDVLAVDLDFERSVLFSDGCGGFERSPPFHFGIAYVHISNNLSGYGESQLHHCPAQRKVQRNITNLPTTEVSESEPRAPRATRAPRAAKGASGVLVRFSAFWRAFTEYYVSGFCVVFRVV